MSDQSNLNKFWNELHKNIIGKIKKTEDTLFYLKIAFVLCGGTAATIAQFLPTTQEGNLPFKLILGVGGAIFTLVGGSLHAFIERDTPEFINQARRSLDEAQRFLSERHIIEDRFKKAREIDGKRRALLDVWKSSIEIIEQASYQDSNYDMSETIKLIFDSNIDILLHSMGIQSGEKYVISVFKLNSESSPKKLERIAEKRWRPIDENGNSRSWEIGEGYTGACWQRNADVIVSDSKNSQVYAAYHVSSENIRDDDQERYRSIAAIPIQSGPSTNIWGVVTVTSDKKNRFNSPNDSDGAIHVEAVRTLARTLALLAGIDYIKNIARTKN